jgi:hypothetical protein
MAQGEDQVKAAHKLAIRAVNGYQCAISIPGRRVLGQRHVQTLGLFQVVQKLERFEEAQ